MGTSCSVIRFFFFGWQPRFRPSVGRRLRETRGRSAVFRTFGFRRQPVAGSRRRRLPKKRRQRRIENGKSVDTDLTRESGREFHGQKERQTDRQTYMHTHARAYPRTVTACRRNRCEAACQMLVSIVKPRANAALRRNVFYIIIFGKPIDTILNPASKRIFVARRLLGHTPSTEQGPRDIPPCRVHFFTTPRSP